MARHSFRRQRSNNVPHVPFYKDERILGKRITTSVSVRFLIAAIVLFVITLSWAMFTVLDSNSRITDYLTKAHASRVADQNNTDRKISNLACLIVSQLPDSISPVVKRIRTQYHCPPYVAPLRPSSPSHTTSPTGAKSSFRPSTTLPAGHGQAAAHMSPSMAPSGSPAQRASSRPTGSALPSPSIPPTTAPIAALPTLISGPVAGLGGSCTVSALNRCIIR